MSSDLSRLPAVSRREFVSMLAVASAAAPFAAQAASVQSKPPAAEPAGRPPLVPVQPTTLHVFAKPMHMMSYADTARLVAETGFGGIDYTVRVAQGHVQPGRVVEDLPRAIDAAHAAGLKVEMITTAITSVREKHTETLLRTAAKYGVKYYRLGYWKYDERLGVLGTLEKLKPEVAELAALNASLGIHGAMQNHSGTGVGAAVWDLYELLRGIDPLSLGVQFDIRHAVTEGGHCWPVGLQLLRPWIRCTDIKDFKWQQNPGAATVLNTPLGEGIVPLDAYFKLARQLNIAGPMSVHLEYAPFEGLKTPLSADERQRQFSAAMRKDRAVLKTLLERHGIV